MRVNVGSIGWAHSENLAGVISPDYVVFSCTPKIDPRLLYWFLTSEAGLRAINLQTAGSVRERLYFASLARVAMPLPPMEEQRRVVGRLSSAAVQFERLAALRSEVLAELDALTLAFAGSIFSRRNATHWQTKNLGEIADVRAGVTLGRKLAGKTLRLPYLRVANVQAGHLDLREVKEVEIFPHERERWMLLPGDILLTEGGDWDKLGRGAVWNGEIPDCIHQNHIFRLRVDSEQFNSYFLAAQIGSPEGKAYFQAASKQTTNLASINQRQLKALPVFCPSLAEQQRTIARLNQFHGKARQLQLLATELENEIAGLKASILNRTFLGS